MRFLLVIALSLFWLAPHSARAMRVCEDIVVGTQNAPPNGGVPIYQRECRSLAGAIAFDPQTRRYSAAWNQPDAESAAAAARNGCGPQYGVFSFYEQFAYIAMSDDGQSVGMSSRGMSEAIIDCQAPHSQACHAVIGASSTGPAASWVFGALAYDPATGAVGKAVNRSRRSDAIRDATAKCGSDECRVYAYRYGYGALAVGDGGRVFGGSAESKGLFKSAAREAKAACKNAGETNCRIVAEGDAMDVAAFISELPGMPPRSNEQSAPSRR